MIITIIIVLSKYGYGILNRELRTFFEARDFLLSQFRRHPSTYPQQHYIFASTKIQNPNLALYALLPLTVETTTKEQ